MIYTIERAWPRGSTQIEGGIAMQTGGPFQGLWAPTVFKGRGRKYFRGRHFGGRSRRLSPEAIFKMGAKGTGRLGTAGKVA